METCLVRQPLYCYSLMHDPLFLGGLGQGVLYPSAYLVLMLSLCRELHRQE